MIAHAIGGDEKSLRKHFSRGLHDGIPIVEGICFDVLLKRVREGHTPSVNKLMERIKAVAPGAPGNSEIEPEKE